ncbi:concanavalin A-like lectin/glucanase domain-containing protein [Lipomyces chichibuensis]|uniref:concanavalin A-like lectin/glucanase domain-containing protein n=1 Tax=Lipomyces chichibuensis TaxID=1546026 RepID=UPI0033436C3C
MVASDSRSNAPARVAVDDETKNNNDNLFRAPAGSVSDFSDPAAYVLTSQSEVVPGRQVQLDNTAKRFPPSPSMTTLSGLGSGSRFLLRTDNKRAEPTGQIPVNSPSESSSSLPLTIGGISESDPAFQQFKSFAFIDHAENTGEWTGPNPEPNLPPSPKMMPADAVANILHSIPDVPPLPISRPSASRPGPGQRKPSVFFHRPSSPSTGSLHSRLPSRSGRNGTSVGNAAEQAGRIHTRRHFVSRRLPLGYSAEKPWLSGQANAEKFLSWIVIVAFVIGLGIIGVLTWVGTTEIQNYKYCTVLEDTFDEGFLNSTIWTHDVQVGGFGNGEFEWATSSLNNSFVRDGKLYIVPTFTADAIGEDNMMNGYTVNLTTAGTCTSSADSDCAVRSNSTLGDMIPPIMSARLMTRSFANIRHGKVEVRAKLPKGDWLWPAIWMMPRDSVYGPWPASGEIDICESRGNDHTYPAGGLNVMSSTLHWGPTMALDQYWKTHSSLSLKRTTFADGFHTFGLEWSHKYIMTYLDGRLRQAIYHKFATPFWTYGTFPSTYENGSTVSDPWPGDNLQAPFDQEFYLILNVAVGGTNGWFPDNQGNKPWNNGDRRTAMSSFWNARDKWQKTWGDEDSRGMVVDSVKIYSMC